MPLSIVQRPKVTDAMSAKASSIMLDGFRPRTYLADRAIAKAIKAATGETVAARTIGRRRAEYKAQQFARDLGNEQMRSLIHAVKEEDVAVTDAITAKAVDGLMQGTLNAMNFDPIYAEEVRVKREALALKREEHELRKRKFEDELQRRLATVREKGEKLVAEKSGELSAETKRRIRELYDLPGPEAVDAA